MANFESDGKAEMMDILTDVGSRDTFARLAWSTHRLRAKRKSALRRAESNPLRLATPVPANINFDLDSYFADSEPYRKAWAMAKSKNSSNPVTHPAYRTHEPTDLARATSAFQMVPQQPDQLSYHRSEIRGVPKPKGLCWQAKKNTGDVGRVLSNHPTLSDPSISIHDNDSVPLFKRLPRSDCPPPPYTKTPNKVQGNITNHTVNLQVPDMFSLLDHPPIAQAVLNSKD